MASTRATAFEKDIGNYDDGKVINDPIYGPMYFRPAIISIIDTPQFQRLRDIKQLGGTCYIYPGGIHTRFDHSLGTCHITGRVLKILKERNADIAGILTDKRILSLEIAALCHDLGQGPFSRVYQDQFLSEIRGVHWDHNENSVRIFDIIWKEKKDVVMKYGIGEDEVKLIKFAIRGEVPEDDKRNRFLYEMVKNRRNGIDCNTFDKILRDCYFVGVKSSFNYMRIVESAKVCEVKGELRLCLRFKEQLGVSALFDSLWALQSLVYTHKTTRGVEMMIAEAMDKADGKFHFVDAKDDPEKLMKLSDWFFYKILASEDNDDPDMAAAKELVQRINERRLYRFCGQVSASPKCCPEGQADSHRDRTETLDRSTALERAAEDRRRRNELCTKVKNGILQSRRMKTGISDDDIRVEVIKLVYGKGGGDSLDRIDFINKQGTPVERTTSPCRRVFPQCFYDEYIRVYCRDADNYAKKREITNRFYNWCRLNNYTVPVDSEKAPIERDFDSEVEPAVLVSE